MIIRPTLILLKIELKNRKKEDQDLILVQAQVPVHLQVRAVKEKDQGIKNQRVQNFMKIT